jgi:multidrug efflux pump subunit AcrA (membrane-fusion protein)
MKTKLKSVIIRSIISLVLVSLTGVLVVKLMVPKQIARNTGGGINAVHTVEVVPVERHLGGIDFKIDGEVIPFRQLDIITEIQGRVVDKSENCRLGRTVQEGELLLKVDPVDYQNEFDRLTEAIEQAKVNIKENDVQLENTTRELVLAKEQLDLQRRDYERNRGLARGNTITAADLDASQATFLSAQESVQRLENQHRVYTTQTDKLKVALRQEEIALKTAKLNLERTEIKSPMRGVVNSDSFEVNSYIQRGASVAKILDTSQLEIQCSLYMKQVQWLWLSNNEETNTASDGYIFRPTPVTILYELDGTTWAWDGTLESLDGGGMNAATRMVPCRVKVDNPQSVRLFQSNTQSSVRLKSPPTLFFGMYVTVIVHAKPEITLFRIPEKALLPGNRIWTATGGTLYQHSIKVAATTPEGVLFYADSDTLSPTDLVVVSPLATPVEGGTVNIVQSVKSAAIAKPIHLE